MKLRQAALLAMSGISIYTAYYLLGVLGVALEVQELIDINRSMGIFIRQTWLHSRAVYCQYLFIFL